MNKFELLIEYVINDEEAKARELFHEIVVEKSRSIYEELMSDEELGGDAADDFIDDIEAEEEGITREDEEEEVGDEMDFGMADAEVGMDDMGDVDDLGGVDDMGGMDMAGDEETEELEDRVVDLEDKLDELMAEFESLMSGEEAAIGADEIDMDADMDMGSDMDVDMDADMGMGDDKDELPEGMDLKAAPKPVTSEEGNINKKSTVAANAGAKGAMAKPVHQDTSEEKGGTAPSAKDMGGTTHIDKLSSAPKAVTKEPGDVNHKSTL